MNNIENEKQNDRHKSKYISENIKYKCINQLNKNSQNVKMNKNKMQKILYMKIHFRFKDTNIFRGNWGNIYHATLKEQKCQY